MPTLMLYGATLVLYCATLVLHRATFSKTNFWICMIQLFMRLQSGNHDIFDVQLVYCPDQLSNSRCATLLRTRGCVIFHAHVASPTLLAICAI